MDSEIDKELSDMMLELKIKKKKKKEDSKNSESSESSDSQDQFKILEKRMRCLEDKFGLSNEKFKNLSDISARIKELEMREQYIIHLGKIYAKLGTENKIIEKEKEKISPIQHSIQGKKTFWINFIKMCSQIKRNPELVSDFFTTELQKSATINQQGSLIIQGVYKYSQLQRLLINFIKEYIECNSCKGSETKLERNSVNKLYFIKCNICLSERSVVLVKKNQS